MQSKKEQLYVARLVRFIKSGRKGNQIEAQEYSRIVELLKHVSTKDAVRLTGRAESTIVRIDESRDYAEYQHLSRLSSGFYNDHPNELLKYEDSRSNSEDRRAAQAADKIGIDSEYVSREDRMKSRNFNLGMIIGVTIITIIFLIVFF